MLRRNFFRFFFILISLILFKKKVKAHPTVSEYEEMTGFRYYGQPSKYEKIFRWIIANASLQGNGLSYTPLSKLNGNITPNGLHFERHHYGVPIKKPEEYRLEIIDLEGRKRIFSIDDLKNENLLTIKTFIECGGNSNVMYNPRPIKSSVDHIHGLFSISEWTGISLKILLEEFISLYRNKKNIWIEFTSFDKGSYNISLPIKVVKEKSLIAFYQNGEPIRPEQGYPMRLVVPGWEGNMWIKWIRRLEIGDKPWHHREETSKYTDLFKDGNARRFSWEMDAKSVITNPSPQAPILHGKGPMVVTGVAWSGRGKISHVDVSIDGGISWNQAKLSGPADTKSMHRFYYEFEWQGQQLLLQSRAQDDTGYVQPTKDQLRSVRGENSIYHNNGIQTWAIDKNGIAENVEVS